MSGEPAESPSLLDDAYGWDVVLSGDETSITIEGRGKAMRLSLAEAEDLAESILGILRRDTGGRWSRYWTDALR